MKLIAWLRRIRRRFVRIGLGAQQPLPVPHHAGLAADERDEDPDDVELDQPGDLGLEATISSSREPGEHEDAVAVRQPVAAGVQLARQVAVLREDRAEHREAVVGGVGGEEQDQRGGRRDGEEAERVGAAEHGRGDLGDGGALLVAGRRADQLPGAPMCTCDMRASAVTPANIVTASTPSSSSVVAAFLLLGFLNAGHAVADRLDAGERRAARGERPQHEEHVARPP